MGFLFHIVLAVAALGAAQAGLGFGRVPWTWALGLIAAPHTLAALSGRVGRGGRFRTTSLLLRLTAVSAPLAYGLLVLGTDWLDALRGWTGARLSADTWPEFALFAAFAPYVLLQLLSLHADIRASTPPGNLRRRAFSFQVRMFAAALVPLTLYAYVSAQVGVIEPLRVQVQEVGLVHAGFLVLLLGSVALLLPVMLTSAWDTVSMPPSPQRELLEAVAQRADFRPRDVRVWRTGNLMSNAAIVGMGDRRVVLFSDSLLASLPPRELAAVYGHEIGHAKRRHVAVFLTWTLGFFLGSDWLAVTIAPENEWIAGGILLGAIVVWGVSFGWLSRRCELEADLYSLELLEDPAAMTMALERVSGRIHDVSGWRHFSTQDRIAFLWRAWTEPDLRRRFRSKLKRIAWAGLVVFVLAAGAQIHGLIEAYPGDQVRAQLAFGDWNEALERARALPDLEAEDLALLELGSELQGDRERISVEELEGGLEAILTIGDAWQQAAEYAGLLVLTGRGRMAAVVETCEALDSGDLDGARALLPDCPERWRTLLASALEAQ